MDVETSYFFLKNFPRTTTFLKIMGILFGIIPSTAYSQDPNWRNWGGGVDVKVQFFQNFTPIKIYNDSH